MSAGKVSKPLIINRLAVITFFFANGFLFGNWTSRLPAVQRHFEITNTMLGSLLFAGAAGAIIAMPFAGFLINRVGSKTVTRICGATMTIILPLLISVPNVATACLMLFFFGMLNGALDVAMNGQAVFVEKKYGKPIMSSFHGLWSIGLALGAATGALFAWMETPLFTHYCLVSFAAFILVLTAGFFLVGEIPEEQQAKTDDSGHFVLPTKAILPLGIIAFCGMSGEGSLADWSAIYMVKVVGSNDFYSAVAFGVFGTAMTIGRLVGDYFTARYGRFKLLIYDSLLAIAGLSIALLFPVPAMVFLGFFMIGLGLSNVVPIIYSTAGNMPGISPNVGIAMATTIGYAGFFVGPPVIGFLSDWIGLRWALCFTLFLFLVMLSMVIENKESLR